MPPAHLGLPTHRDWFDAVVDEIRVLTRASFRAEDADDATVWSTLSLAQGLVDTQRTLHEAIQTAAIAAAGLRFR